MKIQATRGKCVLVCEGVEEALRAWIKFDASQASRQVETSLPAYEILVTPYMLWHDFPRPLIDDMVLTLYNCRP